MTDKNSLNKDPLYIFENDDIIEYLDNNSIEINKQIKHNIRFISKRKNNNYIGVYQFFSGEFYYKIYILPKIFSNKNFTPEELEKAFIDFLKQYYRLKIKYGDKIKTKDINGNISDIIIDNNSLESDMNIDDFIYLKYISALQTIKKIFQKHKRYKYHSKAYTSQSIRHKIDLIANIRSIDKSMIHQIKKDPISYSQLASISLSVLKAFKHSKCKTMNFTKDIHSLTILNINILQKRFTFDKKFSITYKELLTNKVIKLFSKNKEHKKLYQALLILLGLEHFDKGSDSGKSIKIENMISLFFNPADLYEWIVYDYLKTKYPNKILKDKLHVEASQEYFLYNNHGKKYKKISNPDFIIDLGTNQSIVVDAKWKVPKNFTKIDYTDVAKLKRDCNIRKTKNALLVYPELPSQYNAEWHYDDDPSFIFTLEVCNLMNPVVVDKI